MVSETFVILRKNFTFYVVVVALFIATLFLDYYYKTTSDNAVGILWLLLSKWVQESVLYDRKFKDKIFNGPEFWDSFVFLMKSLLIAILSALPSIAVVIYSLHKNGEITALSFLGVLIVAAISSSLFLALIGTWLPAGLYGREKYLSDAFRRGRRSFGKTFGRLLLGFTLPNLINTAVILFFMVSERSLDVIVEESLNFPWLLANLGMAILQAVSVTYVSVVVTRQYMSAERLTGDSALTAPAE